MRQTEMAEAVERDNICANVQEDIKDRNCMAAAETEVAKDILGGIGTSLEMGCRSSLRKTKSCPIVIRVLLLRDKRTQKRGSKIDNPDAFFRFR